MEECTSGQQDQKTSASIPAGLETKVHGLSAAQDLTQITDGTVYILYRGVIARSRRGLGRSRLEVVDHILFGGNGYSIACSGMEMPILERGQNFGIDGRPHTLGNALPHNVSALIDDDFDDDIPFR